VAGEVNPVEQKMASLARRAHGVVTRAELLGARISSDEIDHRVRKGALIRVHRGVYRVGHAAPSVEARYMAAVKACGEGAVLSRRAAGWLLGILKGRPPIPEVTAASVKRVPGVVTHRCRSLAPVERTTVSGIPATSVPRALVDLAGVLPADALARACHEAGVRHRTTPRQVAGVLARRPNAPGAAKLRAVMGGEVKVSLSRLESAFLERLREAGLPLPETNRPAGGRRVDCRWPEARLTVELDSYRFHNSRHSWEQGYRREREARARGDEFRRFTWADVFEEPGPMLAELRALLGQQP
jgi:hypothetical protein